MNKNNSWIDYKELKQKISLKEVLEHYGLPTGINQKKNELIGLCPFHKESNPSFHASLTKNIFHCFGCGAKGNILDFVSLKEAVNLHRAALLVQTWFDMPQTEIKANKTCNRIKKEFRNREVHEKEVGLLNPPLKFSLKLNPTHPYLQKRGLSQETIQHFGLGYCDYGLMKGRIAIPIHNEKGELIAYVGRWPGKPPEEKPKYRFLSGFKKHIILFNFHRAIKERKEDSLIIVEGFFDCMKTWQAGYKNIGALMGVNLSNEQEKLIITHAKEVILMLDRDEAGRRASKEIFNRLSSRIHTKLIELPNEGDQPDIMEKEELIKILTRN